MHNVNQVTFLELESLEDRKRVLHLSCLLLPKPNRDTMEVLFLFLKWVSTFAYVEEGGGGNKMDTLNLATMLAPNILESKNKDPAKDESFAGIEAVRLLLEYQQDFCMVRMRKIFCIKAHEVTGVTRYLKTLSCFWRVCRTEKATWRQAPAIFCENASWLWSSRNHSRSQTICLLCLCGSTLHRRSCLLRPVQIPNHKSYHLLQQQQQQQPRRPPHRCLICPPPQSMRLLLPAKPSWRGITYNHYPLESDKYNISYSPLPIFIFFFFSFLSPISRSFSLLDNIFTSYLPRAISPLPSLSPCLVSFR